MEASFTSQRVQGSLNTDQSPYIEQNKTWYPEKNWDRHGSKVQTNVE